jgi:hypothetical protein
MRDPLIRHTVEPCPHCGERHDYAVRLKPAPLVFGGRGQLPSTDQTISVICPSTKMPMDTLISLPQGQQFDKLVPWPNVDPAVSELILRPQVPDASTSVDLVVDEYAEWVKGSRATGVEFGKNMLTTSSAAVAVYFAVLKYLGSETPKHSPSIWVGVLAPVLFTGATLAFALALQPGLARLSAQQFGPWRDKQLLRMNRFLGAGTTLLILGLAVSIGVYVDLMMVR